MLTQRAHRRYFSCDSAGVSDLALENIYIGKKEMPQATKACVQQELWAYVIELDVQKLTHDLICKEGTPFGL